MRSTSCSTTRRPRPRASARDYLSVGFHEALHHQNAAVLRSTASQATPRVVVRVHDRLGLTHAIAMRPGLISGRSDGHDAIGPAVLAKWCLGIELATPGARRALLRFRRDDLTTEETAPDSVDGRIGGATVRNLLDEAPAIDVDLRRQLALMAPAEPS